MQKPQPSSLGEGWRLGFPASDSVVVLRVRGGSPRVSIRHPGEPVSSSNRGPLRFFAGFGPVCLGHCVERGEGSGQIVGDDFDAFDAEPAVAMVGDGSSEAVGHRFTVAELCVIVEVSLLTLMS